MLRACCFAGESADCAHFTAYLSAASSVPRDLEPHYLVAVGLHSEEQIMQDNAYSLEPDGSIIGFDDQIIKAIINLPKQDPHC